MQRHQARHAKDGSKPLVLLERKQNRMGLKKRQTVSDFWLSSQLLRVAFSFLFLFKNERKDQGRWTVESVSLIGRTTGRITVIKRKDEPDARNAGK